ncbi:hypothetical protein ASA1KI_31720 [Opitutales bacterium ASA1]|uniref:hypothetical protein n=1 Tax=Congregicoccus parvus TaxID=3081749 RepID=UPI002B29D106|nr:hypothetical protein ASA1KI_31720 [Opitutales bacterium ASA1]
MNPSRLFPRPPSLLHCARFACVALVLAAAAGCSTTQGLKFDAIGRMDTPGATSFALQPAKGIAPEDEVFVRAAELARTRLHFLGATEALDPANAQVAIEIGYDVSAPRKHVRTERALAARMPDQEGDLASMRSDETLSGSRAPSQANALRAPVRLETYVTITYEKTLTLAGRETRPIAPGARPRELWRVSVSTEDRTEELVPALPRMVGAALAKVAGDFESRGAHVGSTPVVAGR